MRMDSVTEQVPAVLSAEEEMLLALAQKNTKFDRDELIIPRLKVLQPLSPEVQDGSNGYIEGAKAGMFYNTSSGKLTPGQTGMTICIVGHQRQTIEWSSARADGSGQLIKIWGMDEGWKALCEPDQRNIFNPVTKDGHSIDKQRSFLIFDVDMKTGDYDPSFFNLRSTGNKIASQIANMLVQTKTRLSDGRIITPPYYYYLYKMTLEFVQNTKGKWWAPKVVKLTNDKGMHWKTQDVPNGNHIFKQAIIMQEHFLTGDIQSDWEAPEASDIDEDKIAF